jgi:stage II sporulation protein Q
MTKRRLKKPVVYAIYGLAALTFLTSIYLIERSLSQSLFEPDEDYEYVNKTIFDDDIPVVNVGTIIMKPFNDQEIKILKDYYDYKADSTKQENSLIYYENTYLQNSGVAYGGKENFDIVSILDGTVIDIKEDAVLGKIVEVKHANDMISVYQSLSEIVVKKDDIIKQGDIIGKSGTSNISKDLNDHLYFELIYKGQNVNPEDYYDKKVSDL